MMPEGECSVGYLELRCYYKLMNIIITRASLFSPSARRLNAIDKQNDILIVSVVNSNTSRN